MAHELRAMCFRSCAAWLRLAAGTVLLSIAVPARCGSGAERTGEREGDLRLWYKEPATQWIEALPIGNGRIGAMVWGQTHREILSLNEATCWSGEASSENCSPEAPEIRQRIKQWIFEGNWAEARAHMPSLYGRRLNFGTNLELGKAIFDFVHEARYSRDYRRELDLRTAVATVSYQNSQAPAGAVAGAASAKPAENDPQSRFCREIFASNPDQVIVMRVSGQRPQTVSFYASLGGGDNPFQTRTDGDDTLLMDGRAFETLHSDGKTGVSFHARLRIRAAGGKVSAVGNRLCVEKADSADVFIAMGTTFGGNDPIGQCKEQIESAASKPYAALKQRHVWDYERLFRRVDIQLGSSARANWPTSRRLEAVRNGESDPELAALLFQYVRYLLIAGSRENSPLPMHLQGLWNDTRASGMPWSCDHHLDINVEMHYWPAEPCNLSECHTPLMHWISRILRPSGRRTAQAHYASRGWTADVVSNAWGYSAPGQGGYSPFLTGGAWIASHMWQHYVYTGDEKFLAEEAYPTLKESAEFLLDQLVEHPKYGWLVTGPSASPENAFIAPDGVRSHASMGPTCDVVLIRQLFASCMEAGKILGVDEGFRETLKQAQTRLPPLQIGKHGQLQEWLEDYDEAIPGHRHMAHMLAVYPFGLISPEATPALATAAKTTIERRLGAPKFEDHGWSRALAFVCLARLGCGEDAYRQLQTYMGKFLHNNLLDFAWGGHTGTRYPIFCLDGNGGAAAGVAEMLMQDRSGVIALLPALPSAWPTGHVKGLCAPGGFEVDQYWREGVLERAVIRAKRGGRCQVAAQTPLHVESRNQPVPCETTARGTIRFQAAPGETYVLRAYPNVPGRSQSRLGL